MKNYPQPIYNNVLVQVDSEKKTTIKHGALELVAAGTDYNEDLSVYAQTLGRCVNVPRGASDGIFRQIEQEVRVGDEVVLHYNSIDENQSFEHEGETLYLVPYDYIFAVIRDGEIVMIGGRVLCLPIYEGVEEDGMVVKKTESGIITDINVKHDLKKAILSHIGTPLKNCKTLPVNTGDLVWYDKDADFENTIMGKKYFVMTQEDLLMYQPKNNE